MLRRGFKIWKRRFKSWKRRFKSWQRRFKSWKRRFKSWKRRSDVVSTVKFMNYVLRVHTARARNFFLCLCTSLGMPILMYIKLAAAAARVYTNPWKSLICIPCGGNWRLRKTAKSQLFTFFQPFTTNQPTTKLLLLALKVRLKFKFGALGRSRAPAARAP